MRPSIVRPFDSPILKKESTSTAAYAIPAALSRARWQATLQCICTTKERATISALEGAKEAVAKFPRTPGRVLVSDCRRACRAQLEVPERVVVDKHAMADVGDLFH